MCRTVATCQVSFLEGQPGANYYHDYGDIYNLYLFNITYAWCTILSASYLGYQLDN